jgi:hypothetical protein
MANKDYAFILSTHFGDDQWTLNGDDYEGLTWLSESPKPSQKELDDLWPATVKAFEKKASDAVAARQAILDRLGITADEAKLLLG